MTSSPPRPRSHARRPRYPQQLTLGLAVALTSIGCSRPPLPPGVPPQSYSPDTSAQPSAQPPPTSSAAAPVKPADMPPPGEAPATHMEGPTPANTIAK